MTNNGLRMPPTPTQIIAGHPLAPDMGAWLFNTGKGAVITDLTPNRRNCVLQGAPSKLTWKTKADSEGGGWCITCGNGGYNNVGRIPPWQLFTLPVSANIVLKAPSTNGNVQGIWCSSNWNGVYSGIWVSLPTDNTVLASIGDGAGQTSTNRSSRSSSLALTPGKIYVLTCVWKGIGNIDIYLNGVLSNGALSGTGTKLGWYTPSDSGSLIGFGPQTFSGLGYTSDIHSVCLYHRALNATEAAALGADPYAAFTCASSAAALVGGNFYQLFGRTTMATVIG